MTAMGTATRRADMFTEDGKPSDDDPREHRPRLGDERTTLVESLHKQRLTLEIKCAGLDAEAMARRSVEPSTMSLLGLVRHLAEMERATFRVMMAGQDVPVAGHRAYKCYTPPICVSWLAHSRWRSTNFWVLPVEVFGSGPNSTASGHL
jgi:Protein of unknown function (DUF664)